MVEHSENKLKAKSILQLFVSGWNGFGQWPIKSHDITSFSKVELEECLQENSIERLRISIDWAYIAVMVNSKIVIKGFCDEKFENSVVLSCPQNTVFTDCACNDKHILFYNNEDKYVWKYTLDCDALERWKLLPNFLQNSSPNESVSKIVSSIRMNVALSSEGRIFNIPNEIGNAEIDGKVIDVQCGYEHAMLLTDNGNVYTWGGGSRCQLGQGSTEDHDEPALVEALAGVKITKISAGGWHCCALSEYGDLYTWGWNEVGQLGVVQSSSRNEINVEIKENVKKTKADIPSVSSSKMSNMKSLHDSSRALPNYALPVLIDIFDCDKGVVLENNIVEVSCGSKHTVVKLDDGSFWGTGCNKHGQLGFDNSEVKNVDSFKRLNVDSVHGIPKCGIWTTVIISRE